MPAILASGVGAADGFGDPLLILLLLAFGPSLLYLAGITWSGRGRGVAALAGFLYGASISILVLGFLYVLVAAFVGNPLRLFQDFFAGHNIGAAQQKDFVLIVLVAPILEEAAKGIGVLVLGARITRGREGAFLGAAVGLGFAAIETFTYLLAAMADSGSQLAGATLLTVIIVAGVRSISAALLHPSATALTGYGIGRSRARGVPVILGVLPWYGLAVLLHATYNYLAGFLPPQDLGGFTLEVNLLAAIVLAGVAWGAVKRAVAGHSP